MFNKQMEFKLDTKLMKLLDQYAQDSGFRDLSDLKAKYTDKAYAAVMVSMVARARREMETHQ